LSGAKSAIPDLLYFDPSQNPAMAIRITLDLSVRPLALQVRKKIPAERITLNLKKQKIQFMQNVLGR
jgi:hypothetical protein